MNWCILCSFRFELFAIAQSYPCRSELNALFTLTPWGGRVNFGKKDELHGRCVVPGSLIVWSAGPLSTVAWVVRAQVSLLLACWLGSCCLASIIQVVVKSCAAAFRRWSCALLKNGRLRSVLCLNCKPISRLRPVLDRISAKKIALCVETSCRGMRAYHSMQWNTK